MPPTIISPDARELSVSLFERMVGKCKKILLDTQYRMHPLINEFPSRTFYEGKLKSDPKNAQKRCPSPYPKNVVFLEACGPEERHHTSYHNPTEAAAVKNLVTQYIEHGVKPENIGIISPYAEQVRRLRRLVSVEVNTIDGFQGREKDLIIISLVRSLQMGFLRDFRRLNVALTRAIRELVIVANPFVGTDETYKEVMDFVAENGGYRKL